MSPVIDLYEAETTSTRLLHAVVGSHRFKLADYSLEKNICSNGNYITSAIFTVGGYDWAIRYYLNGRDEYNNTHLACYLELKSEAANINVKWDFKLIEQNGSPSTWSKTKQDTIQSKGCIVGCDYFVTRKTFESSNYLEDDSFEIICTVTILKPCILESTNSESVVVPPSNLSMQLCQVLESGNGADVTFEVDGEYFKAHKTVLAARSPVFCAQFFGPMSNKETDQTIKIVDIEPEVFRVFLRFIYSDLVEFQGGDPLIMYQHLLVIADRYEVERLKSICEIELSKKIEANNFGTTLALAMQHNCSSLKSSCFKFVSSTKILNEIMETDGFEHMTRSCPSILKELIANLSNNK